MVGMFWHAWERVVEKRQASGEKYYVKAAEKDR